ncbi:DNA translocase FtsK [Oecophyllibacter saccharovorans]
MAFLRRLRRQSPSVQPPGHPPAGTAPQGSLPPGNGPSVAASRLSRLLSARLMELIGLGLLVVAVGMAAALFSFNPHDPSFNTATGTQPTNLFGRAGATVSDALIQMLGLGCILPVLVLLAWAWRLVRHHGMNAPLLRIVAALLLLPAAALFVGVLQLLLPGGQVAWPSASGLGGEVGASLGRKLLNAMQWEMGATGTVLGVMLALSLLGILVPLSMGLHGYEWRAVGRGLWALARWPVRAWRSLRGTPQPPSTTRVYQPQPVPARASVAGMNGTTLPSGFPRRQFGRAAPALPPQTETAPASTWVEPPQAAQSDLAPWERAMSGSETPEEANHGYGNYGAAPHTPEPQEPPPNPYAEMLAKIHRTSDSPPPPIPRQIDDEGDEEEYTQAPPPAAPSTPGQTLRRFISRSLGDGGGAPAPAGPAPYVQQAAPAPVAASAAPPAPTAAWEPPSLDLLNPPPPSGQTGLSEEALQANARLLESVLNDYGVQGSITGYRAGPVVTLYELEPAPGVRSARVIGLADDIARSLAVLSVRIATVPGRNVIGIEVPNAERETVYFPELLQTKAWTGSRGKLELALGKDIAGEPVFADLARMPHLLVAGTTGSGKSVGINAMILSLLYRLSPEDCRLILIDPKILELSIYDGIPHLMTPVVTEPPKAVSALKWAVQEMDRRYRLMADHQVRNISSYNDRIRRLRDSGEAPTRRIQTGFDPETGRPVFDEHRLPLEHLPYIVIVIDEMADLMMTAGKEIEAAVLRLAQKARAAGIHVIMATQRPSVDVITGTIKANFPTRISFQVTNKFDSRTILGEQGAEQLLGRGDMLFMQGGARITRVHGPFISDEEVEAVVNDLRSKGQPVYNADVVADEEPEESASGSSGGGKGGDGDGSSDLYEQAVNLVLRENRASTSFVQRHLSIGYNRAANIIDQMEREGIISPANHVGKREILASRSRGNDFDGKDEDGEGADGFS